MTHEVFVSYSTADEGVAHAVRERLESTHKVRCWMGPNDIPAGAAWDETSLDALDRSIVLVLIVASSEREAAARGDRDVQRALKQGIKIIPFKAEDTLSSDALDLRIDHLADALMPLLEQQPLDGTAAPAGVDTGRKASMVLPVVIGSAVLAAMVTFAVRMYTEPPIRYERPGEQGFISPSRSPEDAGQSAGADATPTVATSAAPATPQGVGDPAAAAPSSPAAASEQAGATRQDGRPAASEPSAPAGQGTQPQERGGRETDTAGARTSAPTSAKAVDSGAADAAGRFADPGVVHGPAGTVLFEFTSSMPDGTVEVEVDGVRRWTRRLHLDKTPGVFERLKLQRTTQQFASELTLPIGERKVTITVLNGEGEVYDFGTTTVRVDQARPVTLHVRFSRFRNRLQLESSEGS